MNRRIAWLLLGLGLLACAAVTGTEPDAGPALTSPDAGALDAGDAGEAAADGGPCEGDTRDTDGGAGDRLRFLESCQAHAHDCASRDAGPRCGQCQLRTVVDASQCTRARPCDRLFLLWAAMDCASDEATQTLRAVAARPGWVAACAQPLFPGEMLPTTLGAPAREDDTLTAIFEALRTEEGVWTGRDLLMGGCSAGATRYPVVAARTPNDSRWLATRKNGACFSDGVFDIPSQDRFTGEGAASAATSCAARHQRIVTGYTAASPQPGHACGGSPGGQCACDPAHATRTWPGSCGDGDCLAYESIVVPSAGGSTFSFANGVRASDFAIPHWKLVSEGSDFAATPERCVRDVVPEAPLAGLCQLLDDDPSRSCTLKTFPSAPHCSAYWRNLSTECLDWFEGL
jgi:hypothetical protein